VLEDAPAVFEVLAARDAADLGVRIHRLEDLRDEWRGSELELARDARVVESDRGRIVAYAAVRRHGTLAAVAPDHEGRGIGARLLEWAERREREHGHPLHRQWVSAGNASARTLLTGAGYAKARSYWRLARPLEGIVPCPPAPAGLRLRSVEVERDAARLHALDAASFAGAPDYKPESLELFREEHLEAHDFDAGLSLIAEDGPRIVGCLLTRRLEEEAVAFVALLAVAPARQRQGIGTALLQTAFAGYAAAGLRQAQLMVASDNPGAIRVYERAGMHVQLEFDIYERPIDSEPSRWRSYRDVDAATDPESLGHELDEIASVAFMTAEKRRSLELLALNPGARVLDLGCGTGPELGALAQIVGPLGRVVGLERSSALIAQARKRGRGRMGSVELIQGDAGNLPFADDEFDACRADRTLQHLDDAEGALAEMVRVTRAGGRVVVTESRWGLVAPSLDERLTDRVLGLLATGSEQADWIGHRLVAMFEEAGLTGVESLRSDYTASEPADFFAFTQLRSAARAAGRGPLSREEARAWLGRLEELVARGDAFAMVLILHVAGTRPGG
jgi:mycothiol synthase